MSSLVIVAIPDEDDQVWKISSETKPHITLLYLGEADPMQDYSEIADYIEHAIKGMHPFYMDVDYRGVLGADEADVLFFEKSWDFKFVAQFRENLLKNNMIKQLYHAATQFPEWQPHLTLGYPATPAKPDPDGRKVYNVSFNRIALWMGDSEGPEFRLTRQVYDEGGDVPLAMSAAEAKEMFHFGTKGMKWGVRNTEKAAAKQAKSDDKADAKYTKKATSLDTMVAVNNAAAEHFNARIGALNDKHHDFTEKDFTENTPKYQAYMKDVDKLQVEALKAVDLRPSATGRLKSQIDIKEDGSWEIQVVKNEAKHADEPTTIRIIPKRNAKKQITSIKIAEVKSATLAQAEDFIDGLFAAGGDVELMHYGVKGMRWGQRKTQEERAAGLRTEAAALRGKAEAMETKAKGHPIAGKPLEKRAASRRRKADELDTAADRGAKGGIRGVAQRQALKADLSVGPATTAKAEGIIDKKTGKAAAKTEGGERNPAHADALKVQEARQKLAESGPLALSNTELKTLAARLDLEARVNRLDPSQAQVKRGRGFIASMFLDKNRREDAARAVQYGAAFYNAAGAAGGGAGSGQRAPKQTPYLSKQLSAG